MYFKKYAAGFESPATHFLKFVATGKCTQQQQKDWLEDVWQNTWDQIKFKNEMILSYKIMKLAMYIHLHWQKCYWVMHIHVEASGQKQPGSTSYNQL